MENLKWELFSEESGDGYKEECYRANLQGGVLIKIIDWDIDHLGKKIPQSKKIALSFIETTDPMV